MFQKDKSLFLASSASPFTRNLSVANKNRHQIRISITHKNRFNLITLDTKSHVASDCKEISIETDKDMPLDKDIIMQIKWIEFESITLLVVALHKGIKFYNNEGNDMVFSYSFPSPTDDYPENLYASGIAALDSSVICIGSYCGSILKFFVKGSNEISFFEKYNQQNHNRPICDLTSNNKKLLASCDDTGKICVWDFNSSNYNLEKKIEFEGYNGFSCNCLGLFKTYLCAGYGSGHLRVFDIQTKILICEISAHAKWITSIDVALESGLILSTSEDSFVRVWEINQENGNMKISHKFCENISNNMLFGGVFLESTGNSFCVIGYDSMELHFFKKSICEYYSNTLFCN